VHGYTEHTIHLRGALCSATVDFERNTYVLHRHQARDIDFDRNAMLRAEANSLRAQAWRTLGNYVASKVWKSASGNPYGHSIARAARPSTPLGAARSIRALGQSLGVTSSRPARRSDGRRISPAHQFGLDRRLWPNEGWGRARSGAGRHRIHRARGGEATCAKGKSRAFWCATWASCRRSRGPLVEVVEGDCAQVADLDRALLGVRGVVHLARSNVKTWADYQQHEIAMTRTVAERTLAAGVGRFVYTGTSIRTTRRARGHHHRADAAGSADRAPQPVRAGQGGIGGAAARHVARTETSAGHLSPRIVIGRGGSPFTGALACGSTAPSCHRWGNGQNKLPLVLVKDVASGILAGIEQPGIEGESFNLVGDPLLSADEYLDEIERSAGSSCSAFLRRSIASTASRCSSGWSRCWSAIPSASCQATATGNRARRRRCSTAAKPSRPSLAASFGTGGVDRAGDRGARARVAGLTFAPALAPAREQPIRAMKYKSGWLPRAFRAKSIPTIRLHRLA